MAKAPRAAPIVMKFGGTSLASPPCREQALARVAERVGRGAGEGVGAGGASAAADSAGGVVVVVSAMGRAGDPYATDSLLDLVRDLPAVTAREIDALAACGEEISAAVFAAHLQQRGVPAVSLRGDQAGIHTDDRHRDAEIVAIHPVRIRAHLARGEVVVVAGFQGVTASGDVATLGRGGSDTTAVALGAALGADHVEIYTDVDGVLTADPRLVPAARRVDEVTYHESAELAFKGARVLHPRAAERARASRVAVEIRNTLSAASGTRLVPDEGRWSADGDLPPRTTAVTSAGRIAQVRIEGPLLPAGPDGQARIFGELAARAISLDMISICPDRIAFTLPAERADEAAQALRTLGMELELNRRCAKVTLVGGGIHGIPGIMHRIVRALARCGIAVLQSVDSNMIVSVLVDAEQEAAAVRAIHAEFFEGRD